ncbi:MAG: SMP-30/gluconolactonase/LRE family protein, partial [Rhizobiales bacterium]|nr:SMP-30/gluconolactonase/LRE family protein [Rhizobacter sp.]
MSITSGVETAAFDVIDATRARVGESPLWSVAEQVLWWVDIEGLAVYRHDPATGRTQQWPTGERPACIALHADGGLIAGMESAVVHLRPQS